MDGVRCHIYQAPARKMCQRVGVAASAGRLPRPRRSECNSSPPAIGLARPRYARSGADIDPRPRPFSADPDVPGWPRVWAMIVCTSGSAHACATSARAATPPHEGGRLAVDEEARAPTPAPRISCHLIARQFAGRPESRPSPPPPDSQASPQAVRDPPAQHRAGLGRGRSGAPPYFGCFSISFSSRLSTLPVALRGNSSRNQISRGTL